jgi:hypothetical protein
MLNAKLDGRTIAGNRAGQVCRNQIGGQIGDHIHQRIEGASFRIQAGDIGGLDEPDPFLFIVADGYRELHDAKYGRAGACCPC